MSDDHVLPPPFDAMVRNLLSGNVDQTSLLRVPNLSSRSFWVGAAIGAGAVLLLNSHPAEAKRARSKAPGED
ncbi:hypothetical protein HNR60_001878 [Rhodopseudomonas rhenobacensis]|uniref:Uncharacterized protein n=1 Tax=Rhodopseudomonas rhenobacensis TaxID=87461 RepID=A0A7W7Z368_9BRAD|nr:hypothetical protein [Rhodopseudomonas rhenobacensis]MBB5047126.1 hypothetical protein [Rhodopseudomonas rhenobacensis]